MQNNYWRKDQVINSFFGDVNKQKRLKTGVQAHCRTDGSVDSSGEDNGTNRKKKALLTDLRMVYLKVKHLAILME